MSHDGAEGTQPAPNRKDEPGAGAAAGLGARPRRAEGWKAGDGRSCAVDLTEEEKEAPEQMNVAMGSDQHGRQQTKQASRGEEGERRFGSGCEAYQPNLRRSRTSERRQEARPPPRADLGWAGEGAAAAASAFVAGGARIQRRERERGEGGKKVGETTREGVN